MIQSFKILFLSISILFSFGVTTKQEVCDMDVNKEKKCCESKESCCNLKEDTNSRDDCNKYCCLKSDNILVLNDFFIQNSDGKSTVIVKKSTLLPIVLAETINLNKEDFLKKGYSYKPKILGKQILCYKQTWLI